jgi:hypothetical protein
LALGFALDGARVSQQWREIEEDASTASRPRRRILVLNPNSNEAVTKGLADALVPVSFKDGPEIAPSASARSAVTCATSARWGCSSASPASGR